MDLPDLPSLPDAALSAIIAGAFALVTQALVKVWEVRQGRKDTVAMIYAQRLRTLRHYNLARRKLQRTSAEVRQLLNSGQSDTAKMTTASEEQALAREGRRRAYDEVHEHATLARLYARPPLLAASKKVTDQIIKLDHDSNMGAFKAATMNWERIARWELASIGSVGVSLILYSVYSWGYSFVGFVKWAANTPKKGRAKFAAWREVKKNSAPAPGGVGTAPDSPPGEDHK